MRVEEYLRKIECLPLVSVDRIVGPGGLVVLAPHPDDETLGCGGLIAALQDVGRQVRIVVLTDGSKSHTASKSFPPESLAALRRTELLRAASTLGVSADHVTFLGFADAAAPLSGPDFERAVAELQAIVIRSGADTLASTWMHDPHCDHEAAAEIAALVAARLPGLRLWQYPIWGLHRPADDLIDEPTPCGVRLAIGPWLQRKRAALDCHASQLGLIQDDPGGFRLTSEMLKPFLSPVERFLGDHA